VNHVAGFSGCYILVSTDNGVTYAPPDPTNNVDGNIGGSCIGRFAVDPNNGEIFVPASGGHPQVLGRGEDLDEASGSRRRRELLRPARHRFRRQPLAGVDGHAEGLRFLFPEPRTDVAQPDPGQPPRPPPDRLRVVDGRHPGRVAVVYYGTTDAERDPSVPSLGGGYGKGTSPNAPL
jgi:hypothetical protein